MHREAVAPPCASESAALAGADVDHGMRAQVRGLRIEDGFSFPQVGRLADLQTLRDERQSPLWL